MNVGAPVPRMEGLRKFRLFESSDVESACDRISRVMQPHSLQPVAAARNVQSHMDFVSFSGVGMGIINYGESMHVEVPSIAGYHLIMFCRQGHAEANVDGVPLLITSAQGLVCAPSRPFSATLTRNSEQFVLRIGQEALRAHTGVERLTFDSKLDMRRVELQPWLWQLQAVAGSAALVECAQRNPNVGIELERLLIHLLMDGQGWKEVARNDATGISPGTVKRAEAFIHANLHKPVRLDDIALAAGVPVRTLLEGFKRFKNCSPVQYLRGVRLESAHKQLLNANCTASIATLALDCGFAHLGRFSRAYWERFGETPSQTVKRVRGAMYEPEASHE